MKFKHCLKAWSARTTAVLLICSSTGGCLLYKKRPLLLGALVRSLLGWHVAGTLHLRADRAAVRLGGGSRGRGLDGEAEDGDLEAGGLPNRNVDAGLVRGLVGLLQVPLAPAVVGGGAALRTAAAAAAPAHDEVGRDTGDQHTAADAARDAPRDRSDPSAGARGGLGRDRTAACIVDS